MPTLLVATVAIIIVTPRYTAQLLLPRSNHPLPRSTGGFPAMEKMEAEDESGVEIIEALLGGKNRLHNSYRDFQTFFDNGLKLGLRHNPRQSGACVLNPLLERVKRLWILVVE